MVTGFAGLDPSDGVEGFARAPFILATDVQVAGVWASAAPEWIRVMEQRYDFETAELHTTVGLDPASPEPRTRSRGASQ